MKEKFELPAREPDITSTRGDLYWLEDEWIRCVDNRNEQLVPKVNSSNYIYLYVRASDGSLVYLLGEIQDKFQKWLKSNKHNIQRVLE